MVLTSESRESNADTANKKQNRFSFGKRKKWLMFVLNIEDKSRLHICLLSATLGVEKNTWVSNFPVFLEK